MLANFLAKSKPINFIIYFILFLCFFLITAFSYLLNEQFEWYKVFECVSYFILFLFIFFIYHLLVSKNRLTFDHSYAFFLFILTITLFIFKLFDFKALFALLLYLFFLRKVYNLQYSKNIIKKVFDSGFWLGILFIIEPFSIFFFILIFTSILLHQRATINTVFTAIVGFASPLIIYLAYLFWNDSPEKFIQSFRLDIFNHAIFYIESYSFWIFCVLLLLTIYSLFAKSLRAFSVNNLFKKSWLILIVNLIIAVIFTLFISQNNGYEITFLLVPCSIIIANGFETIKKNSIKSVLITLLLLATLLTFFFS
ncbi:DUF6427 family protein [uncultured Polaribacter sp.]|uniref:DUF6427 family protein n=1 Tax=uncultured Polaribacter sp. TaxID=174711 RepID=UPI002616289F|nr:DUF6427 family protein [uncultured Polaribacter sp.]